MLEIETKYGTFSNFKNILYFMQEENLNEIEILKVNYCLSEVFGRGIYKIEEIKQIVEENVLNE